MEEIKGHNKENPYRGLVYSALDADGNRVGKPLKSSLFGKSYGIKALEGTMKKSGEGIKTGGQAAKTKALVSASLTASRNGGEFRADLREKGVDLILRYGNGGRLFGATFIDHDSRTVLNGSALGKEFSANALGARFADFSTDENHRENLQPDILYKDHRKIIQLDRPKTAQPAQYLGVDFPEGSLLSIFTPNSDPKSDIQSVPRRRKKKKQKYGRQG